MRIIGLIIIVLSLPVFVSLLRANSGARKWACFAVGVLPFTMPALNLDAAIISWGGWSGYSKGFIISLLDTLALAMVICSRKPFSNLPFLGLLLAYLFSVAVSIGFSGIWMSSAFYAFQVIKIVILYVAVASFAGNYKLFRWLAWGLAAGATYQCVMTVNQALSGVVQASGTMGHQNLLGLMLHFVTLPLLAIVLAGERSKLVSLGVLAAMLTVALGASRGSLAVVAIGLVTVTALSIARASTAHKWKIVGLGTLAAVFVVPVALDTLKERFGGEEIYAGPDGEREAFERAAIAMWSDYPMGVGANQYVVVANTQGYSERAGVIWTWGSRSAKVHNMYLLAAAETGWLGLMTFSAMLFIPIFTGLGFLLRNGKPPQRDLVLGATVALLALALHGLYEWVFFLVYGQYMFAITLGVLAGVLRADKQTNILRNRRSLPEKVDAMSRSGSSEAARDYI